MSNPTSEAVPVDTISWISGTSRCFFGAPASSRAPSNEIARPKRSDRSESWLITSNSTAKPTFFSEGGGNVKQHLE